MKVKVEVTLDDLYWLQDSLIRLNKMRVSELGEAVIEYSLGLVVLARRESRLKLERKQKRQQSKQRREKKEVVGNETTKGKVERTNRSVTRSS